jgi:hypothetical protein
LDWFGFETRIREYVKDQYIKPMNQIQDQWNKKSELLQLENTDIKKELERLIREVSIVIRQTSNYEDILRKISDGESQRRMMESRFNNELSQIRSTGEVSRTNITFMQIEMLENVCGSRVLIICRKRNISRRLTHSVFLGMKYRISRTSYRSSSKCSRARSKYKFLTCAWPLSDQQLPKIGTFRM